MAEKSKTIQNLNRSGREKGSKNKSTLLREALKNDFEEQLKKDFVRVVRAVIDKAVDGDMTAAKLLLDRAVPITDNNKKQTIPLGEGGLVINIEKLVTQSPSQLIEGDIEEAELLDVD